VHIYAVSKTPVVVAVVGTLICSLQEKRCRQRQTTLSCRLALGFLLMPGEMFAGTEGSMAAQPE